MTKQNELPICNSDYSNAPCRIDKSEISTQNSIKTHTNTDASNSIKAKQKTIEAFMRLDPKKSVKLEPSHIDDLQKALSAAGNDAWKTAPDYSERNRAGLKDHQTSKKPMPTLKDLSKKISESGVPSELQDALFEGCEKYVKQHIVVKLTEMITDEPWLRMLMAENDEPFNACDMLSEHIESLQHQIAQYDMENALLREEQQHRSAMDEDVMYDAPQRSASKRRSRHNIADDLEGVDESNASLMTENRHQHQEPVDQKVQGYADKLNRIMRSTR